MQIVVIITKVKLLRALKEVSLDLKALILRAGLPQPTVIQILPDHLSGKEGGEMTSYILRRDSWGALIRVSQLIKEEGYLGH